MTRSQLLGPWSAALSFARTPPAPAGPALVDYVVLFPKGNELALSFSRDAPGPLPCPSGDIISPFGCFVPPQPGTQRAIRLKAVYFDENAGGQNQVQVYFNMTSGAVVTFVLQQVASGAGASNFHYSNWYQPDTIDTSYANCFAHFVSNAPYNCSAGIYSLMIEAYDIPASV